MTTCKMTKTALIEAIAVEVVVSKKLAGDLVNTFVKNVMNGVKKNGEVRIMGFGTFKKSKRNARFWVNPATREKIKIPAMNVVSFKAWNEFKAMVK